MNIPVGLSRGGVARGWDLCWQQHCCVPALGVPQDSRKGLASLFSSQVFICRQEGLFDLSDGKSRCLWMPLETAALAVALIRPAVALKVKGRVRGDRGCLGEGAPLADNSPGTELRLSK